MDENIGDTSPFSSRPNLPHERESQRGKACSEGPYRARPAGLDPSRLQWDERGGRGVPPGTALWGFCRGGAGGGCARQVQSGTAVLVAPKRVFVWPALREAWRGWAAALRRHGQRSGQPWTKHGGPEAVASCHCPPFPLPHICLHPFSINLSFPSCLSNLVSVGGVTVRVLGAPRLSSMRRALQGAEDLPAANCRCWGPSPTSPVQRGLFKYFPVQPTLLGQTFFPG